MGGGTQLHSLPTALAGGMQEHSSSVLGLLTCCLQCQLLQDLLNSLVQTGTALGWSQLGPPRTPLGAFLALGTGPKPFISGGQFGHVGARLRCLTS